MTDMRKVAVVLIVVSGIMPFVRVQSNTPPTVPEPTHGELVVEAVIAILDGIAQAPDGQEAVAEIMRK